MHNSQTFKVNITIKVDDTFSKTNCKLKPVWITNEGGMNLFCSGEPSSIKRLKALHEKNKLVGQLRPPRNGGLELVSTYYSVL